MKTKDIFMYALGGLVVICFFIVVAILIYKGDDNNTLSLVIGALIGAFTMVVSYFYGSSKGSADKNEILEKNSKEQNK